MAAPPISKENPDYQNSSPIKLLILKKCSLPHKCFCVVCRVCRVAHAHRYGCSCSSFWADMSTDSTGCLGARKCQGLTKRVV